MKRDKDPKAHSTSKLKTPKHFTNSKDKKLNKNDDEVLIEKTVREYRESKSRNPAPSTPTFSAASAAVANVTLSLGSARSKEWRSYNPSDKRGVSKLGGSREEIILPLTPKSDMKTSDVDYQLNMSLREKDNKYDKMATELSELQQKFLEQGHEHAISELDFEMRINERIIEINTLKIELENYKRQNEQLHQALSQEKEKTKLQRQELIAEKIDYRKSTALLSNNAQYLQLAEEMERVSNDYVKLEQKIANQEETIRTLHSKNGDLETSVMVKETNLKEKNRRN